MAEEKTASEKAPLGARLRRAGLFVLFVAVLLIPKTLALRRRRRLWNGLRLAALAIAAGLLWAGAKAGWPAFSVAGLLILLALLVPPAREGKSVDEQARELGALVVVNGGWFRVAGGQPVETRIYVSRERLQVLDLSHRPLLAIPLAAVSVVRVEQASTKWSLRIDWQEGSALFRYEGFFAEHLARVAETTLRSQLQRELPVLK